MQRLKATKKVLTIHPRQKQNYQEFLEFLSYIHQGTTLQVRLSDFVINGRRLSYRSVKAMIINLQGLGIVDFEPGLRIFDPETEQWNCTMSNLTLLDREQLLEFMEYVSDPDIIKAYWADKTTHISRAMRLRNQLETCTLAKIQRRTARKKRLSALREAYQNGTGYYSKLRQDFDAELRQFEAEFAPPGSVIRIAFGSLVAQCGGRIRSSLAGNDAKAVYGTAQQQLTKLSAWVMGII